MRNEAPLAPGLRVPGSSTSAASMNCRPGFVPVSGLWLYVPTEGFVRWSVIELQVEEAYRQWRIKKSLEGVKIDDGWEKRQAQIDEAKAAKTGRNGAATRAAYLREWRERHAWLLEAADLGDEAA